MLPRQLKQPPRMRRTVLATLVTSVALVILAACGSETHSDVSQEPKYRQMVGQEFRVVGPLLAYGLRQHSQASIEYVTLMPPPGIAGSTVVPLGVVHLSSLITIRTVHKTNRVFDDSLTYLVSVQGSAIRTGFPIMIDRFRGNEGLAGDTSLNPGFYEPVNSAR